jgi:prepilin-type N-terminal cleavage/methylation domain-containing protein
LNSFFTKIKSFAKNKRLGAKNKGFSLLELLVVIIIAVILSTITLLNFPLFSSRQSLQISAEELAQAIREAQIYGIAVKTGDTDSISQSYGIFLDLKGGIPSDPDYGDKIVIFTDKDGDDAYDAGGVCGSLGSECVRELKIKEPNKIYSLCYNQTGIYSSEGEINDKGFFCGSSDNVLVKEVTVLFSRPNPEPQITVKMFGSEENITDVNYVKIVLNSPDESQKSVYVSKVGQISVNNFSYSKSASVKGSGGGGGGCPAVFSWNGEDFVFEHEAVPFALSSILKGTGYAPLNHAKGFDGKILLKIAEEKDEISYLDSLKIISVDLPLGSGRALPDESGNIFLVKNGIAPFLCQMDGKNCLVEIEKQDGKNLFFGALKKEDKIIQKEIIVYFKKPNGNRARLVIEAEANALAEEKAFAYGILLAPIFSLAQNMPILGPFSEDRLGFAIDQYKIGIDIKINGKWTFLANRNFGDSKPFIVELDAPKDNSDKIEIRLRSLGWYNIDKISLDDTPQPDFSVSHLEPVLLPETLAKEDGVYEVLKKTQNIKVAFTVPETAKDRQKQFILGVSGYYDFDYHPEVADSLSALRHWASRLISGEFSPEDLTKEVFNFNFLP